MDPDIDPSIAVLRQVVEGQSCVRLNKMPDLLAKLPDDDFRLDLGKVAAEANRRPASALTEWLVLAIEYQELCNLHGAQEHEASQYVASGLPIEEKVFEGAVKGRRCHFLAAANASEAWPYEVRMGQEVLRRDFNEAEITRQLWKAMLEDFLSTCGETLSKRETIRAQAGIRRLDRIVGLDDPTLIELRAKYLDAMEAGDEQKILAFAKVIAERETALDARRAGEYEAKLASIESKLENQEEAMELQQQALKLAMDQARSATASAAQTTGNMADTAQNVAKTARAAKVATGILRTFF